MNISGKTLTLEDKGYIAFTVASRMTGTVSANPVIYSISTSCVSEEG